MKILLALLLSVAAYGVTASPTAITLHMRKFGAYPYYASRPPLPTTITISGTGSWGMSRGGSLSTACGLSFGYCFNAVTTVTSACSGALPAGSDAGTVYLCWYGLMTNEPAVGTHTGTLTIGTTTINITLIVETPVTHSAWSYLAGFPVGCTPVAGYATDPTCAITSERPTSTAFSIPAVAGTYVDAQFGNTVRRVTPAGQNIQYGALSAFSATGLYVLTSDNSGNVNVYTVATGAQTYSSLPSVNINFAAWDPLDDNILWFMDGASIKYRNLSGATTTTAATYAYSITMGGTVDITDDGWWAFRDSATLAGDICAVNLNGLTTSNQASKTFCASMAALGLTDIDFTQITQVDRESGKRYVIAVAAPSGQVWNVGASTLTYEYAIPTGANVGNMSAEPHSDVGQDENGRQIFYWTWEDPFGNIPYHAAIQLNKGVDSMRPIEEGGGMRIMDVFGVAAQTDGHYGCTWRGVCSHGPYGNSGGITAKLIQTITAANPCQINSTGHGYSSTNSVLIGGAAGAGTGPLNAVHTVTVLNANAYTIPIDCSTGYTYTASSANSVLNASTAANSPFRQELQVSRIGQETRRISIHRSKTYDNGSSLLNYYATPRASISRDGSLVAYASNYGIPEQPSVYVAYTGITTAQSLKVAIDPADTTAVLNYVFPVAGQGAATVVISTLPSLATPVVNASDGLSTQARQYVATGLTADTQYYFRVSTTGWAYTGQFRTLPTLSGTGRLLISKGGGGTVNYGATSGLGSSCSSPCDLAPSKGLLYTDTSGAAKATVIR